MLLKRVISIGLMTAMLSTAVTSPALAYGGWGHGGGWGRGGGWGWGALAAGAVIGATVGTLAYAASGPYYAAPYYPAYPAYTYAPAPVAYAPAPAYYPPAQTVQYLPATASSSPYCREFTQRVNIGGVYRQTYGTACQQPDGSWQVR